MKVGLVVAAIPGRPWTQGYSRGDQIFVSSRSLTHMAHRLCRCGRHWWMDATSARGFPRGHRSATVANVNGPIAEELMSRRFGSFEEVDQSLRQLDGIPDKSRLGANAIVGVSMAAAQAFALEAGNPLWQCLFPGGVKPRLGEHDTTGWHTLTEALGDRV